MNISRPGSGSTARRRRAILIDTPRALELGLRHFDGQRTDIELDAAREACVGQLVYTSLLRADSSPLGLAAEHKATEALIAASGLPHVLLRNGWYTENYLASVPAALQHGAFIGSAGEGRVGWNELLGVRRFIAI